MSETSELICGNNTLLTRYFTIQNSRGLSNQILCGSRSCKTTGGQGKGMYNRLPLTKCLT